MTLPPTTPAAGPLIPARQPVAANTHIKQAAQQFDAMFMGEMLRLARPESKASGAFAEGQGEKSWKIFMDQALGQAAAAHDATGLEPEIEQALLKAQSGPSRGPA